MSSFQGVLIRGVPAVLFIEVSSFQGVLVGSTAINSTLVDLRCNLGVVGGRGLE